MTCTGEVKSFNNAKCWGFITSEGSDVFVHTTDCTDGKPVPGDVVTFDIEEDAKRPGQMKALNVKGCSGAATGPTGGPAPRAKPSMAPGTGSCQGTVKSFNHMKGWGFIVYMDQDIYVHVKDCQGGHPEKGDILTFDLEEDGVRGVGQMKAINVTGGTGWSSAGPGSGPFAKGKDGKGGKGAGIGFGYAGDWTKGKGKGDWGPMWGKGEWGPMWGKGEWGPAWGKGEWGPMWGKGEWGPASYGCGPYGKGGGGDPYSKGGGGDGGKGVKSNGQEMKAGDWICPGCSNHNFASRVQCKMCGTPKQEGW